jgi:hypothetical protein
MKLENFRNFFKKMIFFIFLLRTVGFFIFLRQEFVFKEFLKKTLRTRRVH